MRGWLPLSPPPPPAHCALQQIAKWDAQLGGPKSATPKGCDTVRTQTMNLLMYNMRLLDTTYVASIEITGGFGATKLSNLYNVAAPEC